LDSQMKDVPDGERRKMAAENAIRFFHLEHADN
jgi:hypothetical protein